MGGPLLPAKCPGGQLFLAVRSRRVVIGISLSSRPIPSYQWTVTLVILPPLSIQPHTRFTYHRTWETGLGAEIRVAAVSPDFFALELRLTLVWLAS